MRGRIAPKASRGQRWENGLFFYSTAGIGCCWLSSPLSLSSFLSILIRYGRLLNTRPVRVVL